MNTNQNNEKKCLSVEDAAVILSDTLLEVTQRKTTLRRALVVSRLAVALSKVIEVASLKERVEFLEQTLKKRK
jgi:hypothetical protein